MRYIHLSTEELGVLKKLHKEDSDHRVRTRAQALLLSHRKYQMNQLADLFEVDRDTIGQWFDRWEVGGVSSLGDEARSGRPSKLEAEQKKDS